MGQEEDNEDVIVQEPLCSDLVTHKSRLFHLPGPGAHSLSLGLLLLELLEVFFSASLVLLCFTVSSLVLTYLSISLLVRFLFFSTFLERLEK